jgi:hypothetical protein
MQGRLIAASGLGALESRAERVLAGRVAGVLYLTAAASVLLMLAVPGPDFAHPWVVWTAAGIAAVWGAAALILVPWDRAPAFVSHLSTLGGFVLVGLVASGTGGASSPARHFLIFIVVYAALFYPVREAIPYLAGCAAVRALPLLYVGKIGVPDAILLKPSRLTLDEYETVKDHAILSDEQVGWVRAHHERPDGTGYPDGLAGEEIAEGAAIIALADSWDVMTAPRLYSEPMEPADALLECRDLVGRQFEASCVGALERLYASGRLGVTPGGELAGVTP